MAYHFSANQYEDKYSPRKLGNWEYPKWYPERPRQRFKTTKFIADDNGRLLEGIPRENPWGNYVGTWDLPRRITREFVQKLVSQKGRLSKDWEDKKKKTSDVGAQPEAPPAEKEEKPDDDKCKICSCDPCICQKTSDIISKESEDDVEVCEETLRCAKCSNDVCLCEDRCPCPV